MKKIFSNSKTSFSSIPSKGTHKFSAENFAHSRLPGSESPFSEIESTKFWNLKKNKGFTLVELLVSISVFSVVMVICMGSIVVMLDSNRKSEAERSVMDNLGYTMDNMVRSIRFGSSYHCGLSGTLNQPLDCPTGDTAITVLDSSGTQTTYRLSGGAIVKTVGGVDYILTSPDTTIQTLTFFVLGSTLYSAGDVVQPRVIITVNGIAGVNSKSQSSFNLETMVSQRKLDIQ